MRIEIADGDIVIEAGLLLSAADAMQALLSEVEYEEELLKGYVMCVGYS